MRVRQWMLSPEVRRTNLEKGLTCRVLPGPAPPLANQYATQCHLSAESRVAPVTFHIIAPKRAMQWLHRFRKNLLGLQETYIPFLGEIATNSGIREQLSTARYGHPVVGGDTVA
jgi:hypothetical protein